MILDTSFLIDLLQGSGKTERLEERIDSRGGAGVTAITVMELWEGINRVEASVEEREQVEQLIEGLTQVPFDSASARRAGEISAVLLEDGTPVDVEDVMIAAIALEREEAVVTGNADHFEQIDGLEVLGY